MTKLVNVLAGGSHVWCIWSIIPTARVLIGVGMRFETVGAGGYYEA